MGPGIEYPRSRPISEAQEVLVRSKTSEIIAGLRADIRPRDLLGRMQLLLLALALLNAAGAFVLVVASDASPTILWFAAIAAPPALAITWVRAYRRRAFGLVPDAVNVFAISLISMAIAEMWNADVIALLTATVIFAAAYGSLRQVLIRTAFFVAIVLGQGLSDATSLTIAVVFAVGFIIVAGLMSGMANSVARYETTARRGQILAATGLDLVAASDMPEIAACAAEGAAALCASLPGVRAGLAMIENPQGRPLSFRFIGAVGQRADELSGALVAESAIAAAGHSLADQRLMLVTSGSAPAGGPFLAGELLLTRVSVGGSARGVLTVESPAAIPDDLPGAIRALATQVSLAISRTDLQQDAIERRSAERFEALVKASSDVISIVSPDGRVRFQSPSVRQIFGYDPDHSVGMKLYDMIHPEDADRFLASFRRVVESPTLSIACECRMRHADGTWRHTETHISNLVGVPAVGGIVLNTRDVTERHTLEAELRHQAFHDSLTGLANRALFTNRVEHALAGARRDNGIIAVLYCDIDGMQRVNDSLGYKAGDVILKAVSDRLSDCVRGQDTVARLGGNEFGILLDRLASPSDATKLAMERVMAALRQPISLNATQVELQPHIGIAFSMGGEESAEDLLRNGAVAMHQARLYEGGYALFDPEMHAEAIRRIEVESQLRTAIDESQFTLHYQPTIDLITGRLTGVEALVRWQHPTRGLVPPLEFIPLAEESGLIVPLGQWTIQEACRQVRVWQREIPADEPIALNVNLSVRQLHYPNLVNDVADALDDSGLLPSRLILEITESALMVDTAATLSRLFQLKSLGVRLAVDDFGTGYSSFAYLRRFPVDILKIDKSFVDGVATEPTASALVDAMIRIGKTLRLETVAEGVEKSEQADRLRTLQCDIGQGFLWSRPLPSDAITTMLRERAGAPRANAA
jgi:diguanylate cyclase (GGDEF)-like protein/PAS domain S-box-containing protein